MSIDTAAGRLHELDREVIRIETRAEIERRALTTQELTKMDTMLDEVEELEGSHRKTPPDTPGRRASETAGALTEKEFQLRGWREYATPNGPQNSGGFRGIGDFLSIIKRARMGQWDRRLDPFVIESRTMSGVIGADGGFAVPSEFQRRLDRRSSMKEPWLDLRTRFEIAPSMGNTIVIPTLGDADRSSDEVGGLKLYRTGEGGTFTNDQLELEQKTMTLSKLGVAVEVSNELLSDNAVGLDRELENVFGDVLALTRAKDCIEGTGAGEPMGISVGLDKYSLATATGAGALLVADAAGMVSRLEGGGGPSTAWIMHISCMVPLAGLRFSVTAGEPALWLANAGPAQQKQLYGFPIFWTDSCETSDTTGDIWLGNWDQYYYFSQSPIVDFSPHEKFSSDKSVFRMKLRDNGQPSRTSTLTDRKSYEVSNFVRLATRS